MGNYMDRIIITFINCVKLMSFKYWKLLYNEFPYKISVKLQKRCVFFYCRYENPYIHMGILLTRKEQSTALLHEIGHYINYSRLKANNLSDRFDKQEKVYDKREEKNAWKWAVRLSRKYNLEMCPDKASEWLGTYGFKYKVLYNLSMGYKKGG